MNKFHTMWILFCSLWLLACNSNSTKESKIFIEDWDSILEKGELTIVTLNSSTSYFIYKDEPMGYDYELAQDFCEHHDLKLNVILAENVNKLVEYIYNGEANLIAYDFPIRLGLKDSVVYCGLNKVSHQVLVQRANLSDTILKKQTELIGKEVYVKYNTKHHLRLLNLNDELGGGICIRNIEKDSINSEDIIAMVANNEIQYTIADEYIAKLNKTYFHNIDVSMPLSFDQRVSWAVHKDASSLADTLNKWHEENNNKPIYKSITKRYFEQSKPQYEDRLELDSTLPRGSISCYDSLFKKYTENTNFDWELIAAISYQETRFVNHLTSWSGAAGIMGLMKKTATSLDLASQDRMNPELSIKASVRLLNRLDKIYKDIEDSEERLKFVLAAYNGGIGHVSDARKLADKYGADPNKWDDNVREYVRLKKHAKYYKDPVCKHGYFRSSETIRYVYDVLNNTERFKKIVRGE